MKRKTSRLKLAKSKVLELEYDLLKYRNEVLELRRAIISHHECINLAFDGLMKLEGGLAVQTRALRIAMVGPLGEIVKESFTTPRGEA